MEPNQVHLVVNIKAFKMSIHFIFFPDGDENPIVFFFWHSLYMPDHFILKQILQRHKSNDTFFIFFYFSIFPQFKKNKNICAKKCQNPSLDKCLSMLYTNFEQFLIKIKFKGGYK